MSVQFRCTSHERIQLVRDHVTLNGIEYLDVLDNEAPSGSPRQRTLLVHLLKPATLARENMLVEGGVRISPIKILWAHQASSVPAALTPDPAERAFFQAIPDGASVIVVRTDASGDYSRYRFRLVDATGSLEPPTDFDPMLSEVDFSFKVECPSDFDCRVPDSCIPAPQSEPLIDYLAKDYESLRRLMLDRIAVVMPEWTDQNPADVGITLVEMLAYVGDHLSYYQDAVSTEAYLATARRRTSVRRHAKLLDYRMHDGCNARCWIWFDVSIPELVLAAGTQVLTGTELDSVRIAAHEVERLAEEGDLVFETMHEATLRQTHGRILFYTWSDSECCLPAGATRASLLEDPVDALVLSAGDVLIFEEVRGAISGLEAEADRDHRHAVRLTSAVRRSDPLDGTSVIDIEWHRDDALPFPLCLSARVPTEDGNTEVVEVSVARGNIVLADHGLRVPRTSIVPDSPPERGRYRPTVPKGPVTFAAALDDESASSATSGDPRSALPMISLFDAEETEWDLRADLLASDSFDTDFVVETESDGIAHLRFGDGVHGREPEIGGFEATWRIGNGRAGNVGAETIRRVVSSDTGITRVLNPFAAGGGTDPESLDQVRLYAPQAFRVQERAVTEADYGTITARRSDVQRGVGTIQWTGSWHTMETTVDRLRGLDVDEEFRAELVMWLDGYRMAGLDLRVDEPLFVPLDIAMDVCVEPGYFRASVRAALLEAFSSRRLATGTLGFFHQDNFTFGQPLYLSRVIAAAMDVPGVRSVEVTLFQRWGRLSNNELTDAIISADRLEILRLDNDPSLPENGRIEFTMRGGL